MKSFFIKHKYLCFLVSFFLLAELLVNPTGNFPLNDDWSYAKSVTIWIQENRFTIGNWGFMTLASHLSWGYLFCKVFGFSFFVLRVSTLVSALIGAVYLFKFVFETTKNNLFSFVSAAVLLFNPMFFNLSNTYMTDVNFTTLLIVASYSAWRFFKTQNVLYGIPLLLFSCALVLLRQFGIIFPVCLTIAAFFSEKKWPAVVTSLLITVSVYFVFKGYEQYLRTAISPDAGYKFSSSLALNVGQTIELMMYHFTLRGKTIVLSMLVYTSPLALLMLPSALSALKVGKALLFLVLGICSTWYLTNNSTFFPGNIFDNMLLGPETFYESSNSSFKHTYSPVFEKASNVLIILLSTLCTFGLLVYLDKRIGTGFQKLKINPMLVLSGCFILGYVAMLLVVPSYFDRYHLPLITFAIVLFTSFNHYFEPKAWASLPVLALFIYISVAGTHDYLQVNRVRWKAYDWLKLEQHAMPETINAGFEVNCWNEGKETWWTDYHNLNSFDYLIQYKSETDFSRIKTFEFTRWFSLKHDTLNVFTRISKNNHVNE